MDYGGPYELKVYGDDTLTLENVMIGEVWLCGGQSNMRMTVRGVVNAKEEIAAASHENIRFLAVPLAGTPKPMDSFEATWEICSPSTVESKTAAGYFFGRKLNRKLDVAIGLIDISYGGADILTFMDEQSIAQSVDTSQIFPVHKRWDSYKERGIGWEQRGRKGQRPNFSPQHFPSLCYNAMVHPLLSFSCKGVIWYQGESNAAQPEAYIDWFGAYLHLMREKFDQADLPFYYVQLAGFENQHNTQVQPEVWAKFRLAQEECLKFPHTGMATAMDIGMKDNIHPRNKQEVGRRLALCALNQTYGKTEVACRGPQLKSIERKGKK